MLARARRELVPSDRLSCVRTFTRLFDALATREGGVTKDAPPGGGAGGPEALAAAVELWFQFCLVWGVGGTLDSEGRKRFDAFMRCARGCLASIACAVTMAACCVRSPSPAYWHSWPSPLTLKPPQRDGHALPLGRDRV